MISVFDYQEFREYLQDYYVDQKTRKTGLTYSRFSAAAGIRSPNYLKVVIDAQKNLTPENIVRFAKALQLKDSESDYFEALVHYNQSKIALEREFYGERLQRVKERNSKQGARARQLSDYEFEAVSDWRHHAIMVLTNTRGFNESLTWVRERLFGLVSEQEIQTILDRLKAIQLIRRDETNGHLKQTNRQIKSKPELGPMLARAFYEGIFARASQALKLSDPAEREFSNYVVGLSPKQVPELKRKVREFMSELNDWALENHKPHQVYAINFAAFPLTSIDRRHKQ